MRKQYIVGIFYVFVISLSISFSLAGCKNSEEEILQNSNSEHTPLIETDRFEEAEQDIVVDNESLQEKNIDTLLFAENCDQLYKAADYGEYDIEEYEDFWVVNVSEINGMVFQACFSIDENNVCALDGSFETKELMDEENISDVISGQINSFIEICNKLFNNQVTKEIYHIYSNDGYPLDLDLAESYEKIAKGEATFALYVKDSNNNIWIFEGFIYDNRMIWTFSRYFTEINNKYENLQPDLILK